MVSTGASGTATVAFTTTANAAGFQIAIAPDSGTPWIAGITDNIETTLATITMTKPTEAAIGDLLVLIIGNMYDNNSLAFPSTLTGWTMRWNYNGDGFRTQSACYTRVADGISNTVGLLHASSRRHRRCDTGRSHQPCR